MLKIVTDPKFNTTVKVNTLAIQGEFPATFRVLPSDELKALDDGQADGWKALLARVVINAGPVEIAGAAVRGDTPGGLADLIRWPGVGPAMLAAYWAGLYEAAQGN